MEVTMLRIFTVGFLGVYESCLLFLVALPGLIDTLLNSCQLKGTYYICSWHDDGVDADDDDDNDDELLLWYGWPAKGV